MDDQFLPPNGLRVLVVDSCRVSREMLMMVLQTYGIKTIAAASADEGINILQQDKPDLLISEINLTQKDGYSLMRQVKALEIVQIPAIALTSCTRERDRALAVGFNQYLLKPFEIDELIATVACLTRVPMFT